MYSDMGLYSCSRSGCSKTWTLLLGRAQSQRRFPDPHTDIMDALGEALELQ